MASGIYAIVNLTNGDRYVGSASHLQQRKSHHLNKLRRNTHGNRHLQAAWNKYGEECFEFIILEHVGKEFLLDVEQRYLDETRREYNIATVAWAPQLGKPLSAETRAKQSASLKGKEISKERRAKISAALMGHAMSEVTRAKISAATKGKRKGPYRPRSKEHTANLAAAFRRRRASAETKAKMSASRMGHSVTAETRAKISEAHKGRRMSDETKAKVSAGRKGIPVSAEHRAKLSAEMKRVWADRRKKKEAA